ncbi:hypothetical protein BLOT_012916 [Blomia tropicalis]|nr:hypothetical protein BLOT_012916 [Blomia tropicalis]
MPGGNTCNWRKLQLFSILPAHQNQLYYSIIWLMWWKSGHNEIQYNQLELLDYVNFTIFND